MTKDPRMFLIFFISLLFVASQVKRILGAFCITMAVIDGIIFIYGLEDK